MPILQLFTAIFENQNDEHGLVALTQKMSIIDALHFNKISISIVVFNFIRTWKQRYLISPYWSQSLKTKNYEHGPVALTL